MFLMVDVVSRGDSGTSGGANQKAVNHVGSVPGQFRAGPLYGPFSKPEHFHKFCIPDWEADDQLEAEQCELRDLR